MLTFAFILQIYIGDQLPWKKKWNVKKNGITHMLLSKERCNVWGGGIIYIWTHTYKYYHKPLHSKKSKKKKCLLIEEWVVQTAQNASLEKRGFCCWECLWRFGGSRESPVRSGHGRTESGWFWELAGDIPGASNHRRGRDDQIKSLPLTELDVSKEFWKIVKTLSVDLTRKYLEWQI